MKVLNGKRSTIVLPLDSGQTLQVKPGQFSNPFIGTVALVRSIISSGTPKQIGFVVSNSYELNIIKSIPAATSYYYATEEEAKAAILEGKDFTERPEDPSSAKIKELTDQLAQKDKELEELKRDVSMMSSVSEDDYNTLRKQVADKDGEIASLKSRVNDLTKQAEKLTADNKVLIDEKADLQAQYDKVSTDLLEADNKLKNAVIGSNSDEIQGYKNQIDDLTKKLEFYKELETKYNELKDSANNSVAKSELESVKAEAKRIIEAKDAEIENLKADGAKLVENYNKAKSAATEIMEKFGISYVDGQYVQTMN